MDNNFYLPNNTTGIVIKVSGGADSSILYYALCYHMVKNNIKIPLYAVSMDTNKKPWYSHYAKKIIKFTEQELGISPIEHRITFLDGEWSFEDYDWTQHTLMMSVIDDGLANVAFSGLTQNPNPKDLNTVLHHKDLNRDGMDEAISAIEMTDKTRNDHSDKNIVDFRGNYTMIRPFVQETKKTVCDWYKKYGVLDTLFPLTYSCEGTGDYLKKSLGIVDGFEEKTHCGCCWFCMERIYGFNRIV